MDLSKITTSKSISMKIIKAAFLAARSFQSHLYKLQLIWKTLSESLLRHSNQSRATQVSCKKLSQRRSWEKPSLSFRQMRRPSRSWRRSLTNLMLPKRQKSLTIWWRKTLQRISPSTSRSSKTPRLRGRSWSTLTNSKWATSPTSKRRIWSTNIRWGRWKLRRRAKANKISSIIEMKGNRTKLLELTWTKVEGSRILDLLHRSTTTSITSTRQTDRAKTIGQLVES